MLRPAPMRNCQAATAEWLALSGLVAILALASPLRAGESVHKSGHPASHHAQQALSRHALPLSFADAAAREHAQSHPECTCRAQGRSYQLGTQICLQGALFRCAMDLNVTSWESLREPCPQS